MTQGMYLGANNGYIAVSDIGCRINEASIM
jgi:hypothetical protein